MATKVTKESLEALRISSNANNMESLYQAFRVAGKRGINDPKTGLPVPATANFKAAVIEAYGSDPFAVKAKKVKAPKAPKAEKPPKPPKAVKVRTLPYVSVNGKVSEYQQILDLCLTGGGNGKTVGEVNKMIVAAGIKDSELAAHISLNVIRDAKQFSNRGRTTCSNYGDKRGSKSIVNLSILSILPTLADRNGKLPKHLLPAPEAATAAATAAAPAPEATATSPEVPVTSAESAPEASPEPEAVPANAPEAAGETSPEPEAVPEIPAT